jgi:hypothetical protein
MVQVAPVAAVVAAAPPAQTMSDNKSKPTTLAALMGAEKVKIKQKAEFLDAVVSGNLCEKQNKYKIKVKGGPGDDETIFKAKEDSNCCQRMCCAPGHNALIHLKEDDLAQGDKQVLYTLHKPFKCASCYSCLPICRSEMSIYKGKIKNDDQGMCDCGWAPPEDSELIGRIQEVTCGGVFTPTLDVFDAKGEKKGQIKGPTCCIGAFCSSDFDYFKGEANEPTGAGIKKVAPKDCGKLCEEALTDADVFKVDFEADMDENDRVTMIAGMMLLDFMFFEDDGAVNLQKCEIKLFDFFCCGTKVPCKINCNNNSGGGGGD